MYPYLYFSNPIFGMDKRFCVKTCPSFSGETLSTLDCYGGTCNYDITFAANGTTTSSVANMNASNIILGYETSLALDRVCLPTTKVLENGLSSAASSITSSLQ